MIRSGFVRENLDVRARNRSGSAAATRKNDAERINDDDSRRALSRRDVLTGDCGGVVDADASGRVSNQPRFERDSNDLVRRNLAQANFNATIANRSFVRIVCIRQSAIRELQRGRDVFNLRW